MEWYVVVILYMALYMVMAAEVVHKCFFVTRMCVHVFDYAISYRSYVFKSHD